MPPSWRLMRAPDSNCGARRKPIIKRPSPTARDPSWRTASSSVALTAASYLPRPVASSPDTTPTPVRSCGALRHWPCRAPRSTPHGETSTLTDAAAATYGSRAPMTPLQTSFISEPHSPSPGLRPVAVCQSMTRRFSRTQRWLCGLKPVNWPGTFNTSPARPLTWKSALSGFLPTSTVCRFYSRSVKTASSGSSIARRANTSTCSTPCRRPSLLLTATLAR